MHSPNLRALIIREPQPGRTTSLTFLFITHMVSTKTGHPGIKCHWLLAGWGRKASSCRPQVRVTKAVVRRWRGSCLLNS